MNDLLTVVGPGNGHWPWLSVIFLVDIRQPRFALRRRSVHLLRINVSLFPPCTASIDVTCPASVVRP